MCRLKLGLLLVPVIGLTTIFSACGGAVGNGQQQQNPFFTLSASPMSVEQGGQGTSTITITPQNGFSGSVNLSVSNLPTGVTLVSFNPNPATASSTLTLAASQTAATGTYSATVTGMSGTVTNTTSLSITVNGQIQGGKIQHVVIIVQENRTPDNLFQGLCIAPYGNANACVPGTQQPNQYDIQNYGITSTGAKVTLTPVSLITTYDLGHTHSAFLDACDYQPPPTNSCNMDGFDTVGCAGPDGCPADASFQYVEPNPGDGTYTLQPYIVMAQTYTFGDKMFQTNEGPSFPAHQYLLSGTSEVCTTDNCLPGVTSTSFAVADNPGGNSDLAGCLAPSGAFVNFIDTSQSSPESDTFQLTNALCADHPTLTDLLETAGLSWTYYAAQDGSIWTAPDAIEHICGPSPPYPNATSCAGTDWNDHVDIEGSSDADFISAINNSQLAAVNWVIPTSDNSDHAGGNKGGGPSWVAALVNAIGQSPYWANTAIFVTWDDFGGWYDHVPPSSIRDSYEYGLRVPLLVISPYAKPGYVSHVNHDFGSILKFVETNFGLGTVDGNLYADSRSDDLSDCFDFNQNPLVFQPIPALLDAEHFLNDKSPPGPPDDY